MGIDAEEAVAAVAAANKGLGLRFHAVPFEGTELWAVGATDEATASPMAGAMTVVGPDSRVWSFSSNPGIHDPHLVVTALAALYQEGVTDLVEDDRLVDRIAEATKVRLDQVRDIVKDAEAGSFRTRSERRLP